MSIQAAWRAFIHRRPLNLTYTVLARRAAVCIQRAWRSYLFQQHCRALAAAQLLVQCTQVLSYVPSLCLTLRGARMIALAQGRRCDVLPGQKLRWAFLKDSGSALLFSSTVFSFCFSKLIMCHIVLHCLQVLSCVLSLCLMLRGASMIGAAITRCQGRSCGRNSKSTELRAL